MNGSVCAITGHSPNHFSFGFDEENPKCAELKLTMLNEISQLIDNGVIEFLSGMALGVDIWGAEIVLFLRNQGRLVRLVCMLPCESRADKGNGILPSSKKPTINTTSAGITLKHA